MKEKDIQWRSGITTKKVKKLNEKKIQCWSANRH